MKNELTLYSKHEKNDERKQAKNVKGKITLQTELKVLGNDENWDEICKKDAKSKMRCVDIVMKTGKKLNDLKQK